MTKTPKKDKLRFFKVGLIPIIMLILSVVFFFISRDVKKDYDLLKRSGIFIDGKVIKKSLETGKKYGNKYYIIFQYSYKGKLYKRKNKVYQELYNSYEINDALPLRILQEDPKIYQIHSDLVFPKSEDFMLLTLIFFMIALMFIIIPNYKSFENFLKKKFRIGTHY